MNDCVLLFILEHILSEKFKVFNLSIMPHEETLLSHSNQTWAYFTRISWFIAEPKTIDPKDAPHDLYFQSFIFVQIPNKGISMIYFL